MQRILFSFFLSLSCLSDLAQQNHFIYIQTENRQPFYLKHDNKLYSSSLSGYLIVPKLVDGSYHFSIGFPKNEWPEQTITCSVNKKDIGYLLKNFGERGWGLFNLQSMEIQMANKKIPEDDGVIRENKTDAFSIVLADVVNDPSIKQREVVKEEAKAIDTAAKETVNNAIPVEKKDSVVVAVSKPRIISLGRAETTEGTLLIYVDAGTAKPDTISVLIPKDKQSVVEIKPEKPAQVNVPVKEETVSIEPVKEAVKTADPAKEEQNPVLPKKETKKEDKKFIDMELPNPNGKISDSSKPAMIDTKKNADATNNGVTKPALINSDCRNFATEDDFLKLRKKMASSDNDEGMMNTAKKLFKSKCFTTEQIKNLSVLFLTDDGKFRFFEMAYLFVSDPGNFPGLQSQLTNDSYITRFKAMLYH